MCLIFAILLHAVDILHTRAPKNTKFVAHIYMHIDSFLKTLLIVEQQHLVVASLTMCDSRIYERAFEKIKPDLASAYTIHDVPNITVLIPLLMSFNHEPAHNKKITKTAFPRASDATVNQIISILNIVNKALPHRYVKRKFFKLLHFECFGVNDKMAKYPSKVDDADEAEEAEDEAEEAEEWEAANKGLTSDAKCKIHENTLNFFVKIMIASLLGLYEWSSPKMTIDVRMLLYRFFNGTVSRAELYDMMNITNTMFLFYVVKDYIMHICKDESSELEIALSRICKFGVFVTTTKSVMAIGRSHITSIMESDVLQVNCLADMFGKVDEAISGEHTPDKTHIQDQSCLLMYNVEKILGILKAHNYMLYSSENSQRQEWDFSAKSVSTHPTLPEQTLQVMRALIACYPVFSMIPLDLLLFFGVPPARVCVLKALVFDRKTVLDRFLKNRDYGLYEYALFYNFINECNEANLVNIEDGDVNMYYNQYMAFSRHYGVKENDAFPIVLGSMLVCKTCRDIKDCSFFKVDTSQTQTNSHGNGKIAITGDGVPMCAYTKKSQLPKPVLGGTDDDGDDLSSSDGWSDSQSDGWEDDDNEEEEEEEEDDDDSDRDVYGYSASKFSMKYMIKTKKTIHTTPAILKRKRAKSVDVTANIKKCQNSKLTTIDVLGRYVTFNSVTFICCYVCIRVMPFVDAFHVGDLVLCKSCRCHVIMAQDKERTLARRSATAIGSGSPIIETLNFCGYCNKYIPSQTSSEKFYLLIDDTQPIKQMMYIPFCNKIHGSLKWIESHCIAYKSLVIKGIAEKWDTVDSNGVYIEVSY